MTILAGGTYASLRDLADYGACLGFDDAENIMDARRVDPDKRALLLAGNRRGSMVTLKEPCEEGWKTRMVHAFCPRLFSAINLPDEVLASRTILVPLVRSADNIKANRDPADHETWPIDRRTLIDDLWLLGLCHVVEVRGFYRMIPDHTPLAGRNLEPWRAVLSVARWLQEDHGVTGIFDRMNNLAIGYQEERADIERANPVRVLVLALDEMLKAEEDEVIDCAPGELAEKMNDVARSEELEHVGDSFTNSRKVGSLLKRLRATRGSRTSSSKRWRMSRNDLDVVARAYGIYLGVEGDSSTLGHAECAVSAVHAVCEVTPICSALEAEKRDTEKHLVSANSLNWDDAEVAQ
jgi:hypothetical protein